MPEDANSLQVSPHHLRPPRSPWNDAGRSEHSSGKRKAHNRHEGDTVTSALARPGSAWNGDTAATRFVEHGRLRESVTLCGHAGHRPTAISVALIVRLVLAAPLRMNDE